ncbi:MAG TPA: hypothetical protein ENJ11_06930 [Gammaproteobacteria bacterium]|nr:hypothetical protein [Gammaproteobacteria bacterium]
MNLKNKLAFLTTLAVFSQSVSAVPFTFDGRSLGMGGASTATADLATAAWANPAMLTNQRPNDDFALLVGFGVFARDNDDLLGDIQDFQAADDRRIAAQNANDIPAYGQAIIDMAGAVSNTAEKDMAADVSGVLALGIAFDSFAMALSVRSDAIGAGTLSDPSCTYDPTPGSGCTLIELEQQVTSTAYNKLNIEGVVATEFGASFAKSFELYERKVSVGIKPKIVDLKGFGYTEAILSIDSVSNVLDKENQYTLGTFTSMDLGLAAELTRSIRLGLNIRNLITDEFDVGNGQKLNFDTTARLGAAYHNRLMTLAIDYDLTANKPLLANPNFADLKTQYLMAGAEFNAFDFVQLRVGASKNVASGISDNAAAPTLSAGLGFWLGFNLDIAATYRSGAVGGFLQTGFRF